jgi:hypothetical protein
MDRNNNNYYYPTTWFQMCVRKYHTQKSKQKCQILIESIKNHACGCCEKFESFFEQKMMMIYSAYDTGRFNPPLVLDAISLLNGCACFARIDLPLLPTFKILCTSMYVQ